MPVPSWRTVTGEGCKNPIASAVLLLAAITHRERAKPLPASAWGTIAAMGFCGITLFYGGYNIALNYSTATQAAMVQGAIPAVTAVFAVFLLKERPSGKRILGIVQSLLGVVLVVIAATPGRNAVNPSLGGVLMFGSVAGWAFYTIFAKRLAEFDPLWITALSTALGTVFLIPLALFELHQVTLPTLTAKGWMSILYLGVISTAVGHLLYNRSLAHLDASQAAIFTNLIPIFGVAIAVLFLGEAVLTWQIVGGAIVLFGVWLAT